MISNKYLSIFFLPIYLTFKVLVWLKNKFYDLKIFQSFSPDRFTINVGNLAVGGTGKTPMVEYLATWLNTEYQVAILSRGYGRKTRGFLPVTSQNTPSEVGDEPMQYFLKFLNEVTVFVGENRVAAFHKLVSIVPNIKILILDDAFQHRAIKAHINIILTDYKNLIYNDLMLPFGRLREPITSLARAHILVITKCPAMLSTEESQQIKSQFKEYTRNNQLQIYFTQIVYGKPVQFSGDSIEIPSKIILLAGIANADSFIQYGESKFSVSSKIIYDDHHNYSEKDIISIERQLDENTAILTTEKDFVKLKGLFKATTKAFYLPITNDFLMDESPEFKAFIHHKIVDFYAKN